jgi:hypothetical protein
MDRLTLSVATGSGIAWGGQDAFDAWRASRGYAGGAPDARKQKQEMALARLSRLFPGRVVRGD